jgi:hypothetical protein
MTQLEARDRLSDAQAARDEAARLLDELVRERAAAEARLAAGGREDPIKLVTGRSSFDRAIRSTQDALARMDAVLLQDAAASPRGGSVGVRPSPVTEGR